MTCEQHHNISSLYWLFTSFLNSHIRYFSSCVSGNECDSSIKVQMCKMGLTNVWVCVCVCVCICVCACATQNAQNRSSRDRSCAWFTVYILICSRGLSYHRIKYVNVPVEGSLWQRQPRLNAISLNEATQSAFTTDTDSSLFGTSSVGLFGCLFMPLRESVGLKGRLRLCVYIMGVTMYLWVLLLYQVLCVHMCVYLGLNVFVCVCFGGD